MATRVIRILKGYSNGNLDLSDSGHTKAEKLDKIIWQIALGSGVQSIERIEEKEGSQNIFEPGQPDRSGGNWRGNILRDVIVGAQYRYSIYWKNANGDILEYDPIISIRPSTIHGIIARFALAILAVLLVLFTLKFWQQKKNRR